MVSEGVDYTICETNNAYSLWRANSEKKCEPSEKGIFEKLIPPASKGKKSHVLIQPDTFRALSMMLSTSKGKQIRAYYIALEKLIKAYVIYQIMCRNREAEFAMTHKDTKIDQLSVEVRELLGYARETKTSNQEIKTSNQEIKQELKTISTKLTKAVPNHVVMTGVKESQRELVYIYRHDDTYDCELDYPAFRCQKGNIKALVAQRIKSINEKRKEFLKRTNLRPTQCAILTEVAVVGHTGHTPNAQRLWDKFRSEQIQDDVIANYDNGKFNIEIEEKDFLELLHWEDNNRDQDIWKSYFFPAALYTCS